MKKLKGPLLVVLLAAGVLAVFWYGGIRHYLNLEYLQEHAQQLKTFVDKHYILCVLLYIVLYTLVVAFSVPGAALLTVAGGFLFSWIPALVYVNLGATAGATLAFLSARYLLRDYIEQRYHASQTAVAREIKRSGAYYLLSMRLIPLAPFFLVNVLAALTPLRLWTFIWATCIGIIPGSLIYIGAGRSLANLRSLNDIFSSSFILILSLLGVLVLLPVLLKRLGMTWYQKKV